MKKEFKIEELKVEQVNKILRNVNSRKATGPDKIPRKIVKVSANIIDYHLNNMINSGLKRNPFSDSARVALKFVQFSKGKEKELRSKITGQLAFSTAFQKFTKDSYKKI